METLNDHSSAARPVEDDLIQRRRTRQRREDVARARAAYLRRFLQPIPPTRRAAWAEAYRGLDVHVTLDAERVDPAVLGAVDRRRAWQFQVFPLRRERGVLILVTTAAALMRAGRFANSLCSEPTLLLLVDPAALRRYLRAYYPLPGVGDVIAR